MNVLQLTAVLAIVALAAPHVTAQTRVSRPPSPNTSLNERWSWALADARRQRLSEFWIAYSFETPVHGQDLVRSDSNGNSWVSSDGRVQWPGPPLRDVLRDGGGNIVVLMHYRGGNIDRAFYQSARLGFNFGRAPLFWLGFADESQSFDRVRTLFEQARAEHIQTLLIELASVHGNSNTVIPFLTRLVDHSQPPAIRDEAVEGFGHQHDRRSIEILLRVARTDPLSAVRGEAAETIGEVQTPEAISALIELVERSDDPEVRGEAAEAFAEQPAEQALPALERVIAAISDDEALGEAIEAIGELGGASAINLLVQTVNTHPRRSAQEEAVETLGDIDDPAALDALQRIAVEHQDDWIRSEAIDTFADTLSDSSDRLFLDRAEQVFARAIFNDPATNVRMEALDALEKLPRDRELRLLRQVIDRHTDSRVRKEAEEHLRERRQ